MTYRDEELSLERREAALEQRCDAQQEELARTRESTRRARRARTSVLGRMASALDTWRERRPRRFKRALGAITLVAIGLTGFFMPNRDEAAFRSGRLQSALYAAQAALEDTCIPDANVAAVIGVSAAMKDGRLAGGLNVSARVWPEARASSANEIASCVRRVLERDQAERSDSDACATGKLRLVHPSLRGKP